MKLSIIIPVYNVEKYVERCLRSCMMQDINFSDYEIIVINDGTMDNSLTIVESIAKEFKNITIYNQENKGLSEARNKGLLLAKGEYVWFVDSDDWIEDNSLSQITRKLNSGADLLHIQYQFVFESSGEIVKAKYTFFKNELSGKELTKKGGLPAPVPFTIYRKDFLLENRLFFTKDIYHEDSEFKPKVVYTAKKCAFLDIVCYNYLQRITGSITSNYCYKNAIDNLKVCNRLIRFADEIEMDKSIRKVFNKNIGLNLNTLLFGMRVLVEEDRKKIINQLKKERGIFKSMISSSSIKYKIEGLFFLINVKCALFLHKFLK